MSLSDRDLFLRFIDLVEAKLSEAYDQERVVGWQVTPGKRSVKLYARLRTPDGWKAARYEISKREILLVRHSQDDLVDEVLGRLLAKLDEDAPRPIEELED